jgi:CheY-like chemotaxis protein
MRLNETNFDLYPLLEELETMFRQAAADRNLRLRFDRALEVPRYVCADRVKLRQVLINLLGNAVKFTQEGEVALRVLTDDQALEDSNEPAISGQPARVVFEVQDTGPGIPVDEQGHIFDAFVQATAGQQVREGTGLGLAISRQYVQVMGGTLSVHSESGRGAVFTVAIPLRVVTVAEPELQPDARQVVGLAPGQPRYRILVVDDRLTNRQFLLELLAPLGFELREAGDGLEAVASARAWQPHLILLDLRMPLLDGYAAARQIKAEARELVPVIVAVSASSLEDEPERVLAAGCDAFLRKPFSSGEIIETIGRHLGLRYVYADVQPAVPAAHPAGRTPPERPLIPEALAALPAELLAGLEQAVVETNPALIGQRIAQIRDHNPALAEALAALADEFEYARILANIQALRGHYD